MFLRPSLQIASQCALDSGDAAGEVSSMYSTPNASSLYDQPRIAVGVIMLECSENWTYAFAILILVSRVKKALANCSPSIKCISSAPRHHAGQHYPVLTS